MEPVSPSSTEAGAAVAASGNGHGDPRLLTGWGLTAATRARVHRPAGADEVADRVAARGPRGVIARGLGRSYGDAAQNAGGMVLDMLGVAGVREIDLEHGTVRVGAGLSLDALITTMLPLGWFPDVVPGTRHVTVGGALAADIHGKNHHVHGSIAEHVRSVELVTPSGDRVTARPGEEAFAATLGGMGLTGVMVEATLQLSPVETSWMRVDTERASDLDDVLARMEGGDDGYRYSVAWIDCLARGRRLGRSVLLRADHAAATELAPGQAPLHALPPARLAAPPWVPDGLLRRSTVAVFNEVYFRRAPREERGRLEPLHSYFFPLDAVRGWNRLYGSRGFLQYQFVVPFGAEDALRRALERLGESGCASFLAVLKRFGPRRQGLISFPLPGWTLALDIPAAWPGLAGLLDELDELVAGAGGRVYLAKDSRLRPELVRAMYPELDRWNEARGRLDPDGAMCSDLSRRLGLRAAVAA